LRNYKCLDIIEIIGGEYKLVPIRDEDKYAIREWRNEQIEILRQNKPLSISDQENYFKNVIDKLFEKEQPEQLLWSFLFNDELIGYGGLVHIDWNKKEAEISFLTKTTRNNNKDLFINDWIEYLKLIKRVARHFLNFNKIYTYAYDIRPHLYTALEESGFIEINRIKNGIIINQKEYDIVIHAIDFPLMKMRMANENDTHIYYQWANDEVVRNNSYNTKKINLDDHINWFTKKLNSSECNFYFFTNEENIPVGQVRIDLSENENIIGISVDTNFRKFNFSTGMLVMASRDYFKKNKNNTIIAYIKEQNSTSLKTFLNAGFELIGKAKMYDETSFKLKKQYNERH
jgi:RimJ/RimL family protein N-acetyltransferase